MNRKRLKNEKGSITLYVLISMFFFIIVVFGIYFNTNSKMQKQNKEIEQIQKQYEKENINDVYEKTMKSNEKLLSEVVEVGDYVEYIPNAVSTTDVTYTQLISDLATYSGNTDSSYHTSSTIIQESLNWRVLDTVKDENGNNCVRLISDKPTKTAKIRLYGAKGYNNAVYLLDKTCSVLYNNSKYTQKVQNIKIEDIQRHLTYDYTQYENANVDTGKYGGTKIYTNENYRKYPNIFIKEKTGWVDDKKGTELEKSEQTTPINEEATVANNNIKITQTYWSKTMVEDDFTDKKYYNLFINDGTSNYETYWMSSRCLNAYPEHVNFNISRMDGERVYSDKLYSFENDNTIWACAIRPIITLKCDILINSTKSGDGSEVTEAWVLR